MRKIWQRLSSNEDFATRTLEASRNLQESRSDTSWAKALFGFGLEASELTNSASGVMDILLSE